MMKTLGIFLVLINLFLLEQKNNYAIIRWNNTFNSKQHKDSIYIKKELPEYKFNKCIKKLFSAVVRSNSKYYQSDKNFYILILKKNKKYWYLEVLMDNWHNAKDTDFCGIIRLPQGIFLCKGDVFNSELIHKKVNAKIGIQFVISKNKSNQMSPLIEPSLQGTFNSCNALPIYVEIYTSNPITGYKMNVRK